MILIFPPLFFRFPESSHPRKTTNVFLASDKQSTRQQDSSRKTQSSLVHPRNGAINPLTSPSSPTSVNTRFAWADDLSIMGTSSDGSDRAWLHPARSQQPSRRTHCLRRPVRPEVVPCPVELPAAVPTRSPATNTNANQRRVPPPVSPTSRPVNPTSPCLPENLVNLNNHALAGQQTSEITDTSGPNPARLSDWVRHPVNGGSHPVDATAHILPILTVDGISHDSPRSRSSVVAGHRTLTTVNRSRSGRLQAVRRRAAAKIERDYTAADSAS